MPMQWPIFQQLLVAMPELLEIFLQLPALTPMPVAITPKPLVIKQLLDSRIQRLSVDQHQQLGRIKLF